MKILDFGFILMIFLKTFLIFLLNDGIFASAVVDTDGTAMSANTDDGTSAIAALADDGSVRSTPNEKAGGAGAGDSNEFHGERHLEIEYFLLQKNLKDLKNRCKSFVQKMMICKLINYLLITCDDMRCQDEVAKNRNMFLGSRIETNRMKL